MDLEPGRKGRIGQLISVEFQDGQGPYLNPRKGLRAFVEAHLRLLEQGRFTVDEEGFVELDG